MKGSRYVPPGAGPACYCLLLLHMYTLMVCVRAFTSFISLVAILCFVQFGGPPLILARYLATIYYLLSLIAKVIINRITKILWY